MRRCQNGTGAVVASLLKGGEGGDGIAFCRAHARIQSHHRWRLNGVGRDACVHHQELSMIVGEGEDATSAECEHERRN
jgi:hypothetical protein